MEQKNDQPQVPCLPESAPFTSEQRAYLNGFLAGLFSRAPAPAGAVPPAARVETLRPLSILFGSQPDNAKTFWEFLSSVAAPKLPHTRFSICALGDSNYLKFCGFGKELDTRLESLAAQRVHPRAD